MNRPATSRAAGSSFTFVGVVTVSTGLFVNGADSECPVLRRNTISTAAIPTARMNPEIPSRYRWFRGDFRFMVEDSTCPPTETPRVAAKLEERGLSPLRSNSREAGAWRGNREVPPARSEHRGLSPDSPDLAEGVAH